MIKKFVITALSFLLMVGLSFAGNPFNYPVFQAIDSSGNPISGGLVYTYEAGTTTNKTAYTDEALTTPATNPIVLDSKGQAVFYLSTSGLYKINVTTSVGVQVSGFPLDDLAPTDFDLLYDAVKTDHKADYTHIVYTSIAGLRAATLTPFADQKATVTGYYASGDGGGGDFYWDSTSTTTDNDGTIIKVATITTGRWKRINEVLKTNLKWFGAKGDGSNDDTSEVQAAVTFVEGFNGELFCPYGTYDLSSTVSITSGITITGIPNQTIFDMSVITADTAFDVLGSVSAVTEVLTVNAADGDLTITVADGSVFAADDWCLLRSAAVTGAGNIKKGEIIQILGIVANVITFKEPINDAYTTADTATLDKLTLIEDVTFDGIKILGGDTVTDDHVGIFAYLTKNLTIKNCFFKKTHDKGIRSLSNIGFQFLNNRFEDILDTGTGYGMSLTYACQDGVVSGNIGKRMRHLVTHGGGGTYYGVPRRIIIDSNICYQSTEASFDAHSGAEDLTFSNNTSHGSAVDGIIVNCSRAKIIGNTVINAQRYGIFAQLTSAKPMEVMIHDNVIKNHDATSRGIFATVSNATYYDVESISIQDNIISNCSIGIDIYTSLAITIHGVSIIGNSIHGGTEDSIQMEKCVEFIVADNNFDYLTTKKGIELDACTDGIIKGNVGLGSLTDTATIGINLKSATNVSLSANLIHNSNKGIVMDNSCDYNILMGNITRTCTTPFTAGTGVNHIYETAASDPYNSF